MPIADIGDYTFTKKGDVTIYFAAQVSNAPGTWNALGCPEGTWNVNRQTAMVEDGLDGWCDAVLSELANVTPGQKTIDISGTMRMILSDAAYQAMDTAEGASAYCYIRITKADSADATTVDKAFGGYLTQFQEQLQGGNGPSNVSIAFRAVEKDVTIA